MIYIVIASITIWMVLGLLVMIGEVGYQSMELKDLPRVLFAAVLAPICWAIDKIQGE